ncbi:hypothetical protein V5799_017187 [Amblyomma americanum]|uniref:Lipocalin n=1 Tax=Amblyomma americanum TaxID=6943 RepID=A0AAQ4F3U9_AMBAM
MLHLMFTLAFLLPSLLATSGDSEDVEDTYIATLDEVTSFLNTTANIWLYLSSEEMERRCLSIKKISEDLSSMKYEFKQTYLDKHER